jgi:hypothetical protein
VLPSVFHITTRIQTEKLHDNIRYPNDYLARCFSDFNVACGLIMTWIAIAYAEGAFDGNRFTLPIERTSNNFLDRASDPEAISGPIERYVEFWPWLLSQAQDLWYVNAPALSEAAGSAFQLFNMPIRTIVGLTITAGWAAVLIVATPPIIWIAATEISVLRWRIRYRIFYSRFERWSKEHNRLLATVPEDATPEAKIAIINRNTCKTPHFPKDPGLRVCGALTGGCHSFGLKNSRIGRRISRVYRYTRWLNDFEAFQYKLGDIFLSIMGILVPAIAGPYIAILFAPLLLTIGVWLLVVIFLLIGFIPFAFLHANGVRIRML